MQGSWSGYETSAEQDAAIVFAFFMLFIIGLCMICYVTQVYTLLPGWGPITRYDSTGKEADRLNEWMIYKHAQECETAGLFHPGGGGGGRGRARYGAPGNAPFQGAGGAAAPGGMPGMGGMAGPGGELGQNPNGPKVYAIGPETWGSCEGPMHDMPINHPTAGKTTVKEGFGDTQKMRENSPWWGKDEIHFMHKDGRHGPPLRVNEAIVVCPGRMV